MGTSIIDCVEGTIHIKEGYLLILNLYHLRLAGSDFMVLATDCGWTPSSAEQKSQPTLARQSQEPLALNSPRHFPLRRTSCVPPVWPQIPLEAFFNDGGGSLQRHEYHMEKSCQDEFRGYFASGSIERRLIKSQRVCVVAR